MSIQENRARCAREEIFNQENLAIADEIFSPAFAWYESNLPPLPKGPEGIEMFATLLRGAFPDFHPRSHQSSRSHAPRRCPSFGVPGKI